MLRYGAFSYKRIWTLDILMIILVSAVIVDIAFIIMMYQQVDGFVFLIAFLVAVLTSSFWYLDTGVRRVFERYFLRHQHDADILYGLIKCLNVTIPLEASINQAINYIALRLQLEWVAIRLEPRLIKTVDHFYIMETKRLDLIHILSGYHAPAEPSSDPLSYTDSIFVNYDEQAEPIGLITLGRKISSEGFDKKDRQLIKQIAQYISWFVVANNQIELINMIVDRILKARDNIFNDLNHLIHDEIMAKLHWIFQQIDLLCEYETLPLLTQSNLRAIGTVANTASSFLRASIIRQQIAIPGVEEDFLASMLAMIHQLFPANSPVLEWISPKKEDVNTWQNFSIEHKRDIYRIIHSAITNALNHGSPDHVSISFNSDMDNLLVSVTDNGTGFDTKQIGQKITSTGLMTMMERSRGIGAKLNIQSSPGDGTKITLSLSRMLLSASPAKPYVLQAMSEAISNSEPSPPDIAELPDNEDIPTRITPLTPLTEQAQVVASKAFARIAVVSTFFGLLLGGFGMLLFQSSKHPAADPPRPAIKGSLSVDEHRDYYGTPVYLDARKPNGMLRSEDILDIGDTLTVTFQVRNTSAYSLYAKILALGSHGPGGIVGNWSAPGVDFPTREDIWIDSGEAYSMTTTQIFNTPGDYFIEPIFQDMYDGWHGIEPFPRIIFFVVDRVSPIITQTLLIHANQDWQYTDIYAQPGDIVSIKTLNGRWTTDINSRPLIDAEGYLGEQPSWLPVANANLGQLVGTIGSWEFSIGQEESFVMPAYQGMIRLKVNDAPCEDPCLLDNQGAILVSVTVLRQK